MHKLPIFSSIIHWSLAKNSVFSAFSLPEPKSGMKTWFLFPPNFYPFIFRLREDIFGEVFPSPRLGFFPVDLSLKDCTVNICVNLI